jgi:methyl-accepting chemotaxis protein
VRTFRFVVVAALVAGAFAILAPAIDASVSAASNPKFCKAVENISATDPTESGNAAAARQLAKATRSAAKLAPTKVRNALNTMADYYNAVAEAGNNPAKLAGVAKLVEKYTKAFATYTSYFIKTCTPGS